MSNINDCNEYIQYVIDFLLINKDNTELYKGKDVDIRSITISSNYILDLFDKNLINNSYKFCEDISEFITNYYKNSMSFKSFKRINTIQKLTKDNDSN